MLANPRFGRFVLDPVRRSLTADGVPVELSARAFDLLLLLVERRDQIVSKDDLRALVWRGATVDDNNLAVQISLLRRALGEKAGGPRFILTVPGRGYQFVAPVQGDPSSAPDGGASPAAPPAPIPLPVSLAASGTGEGFSALPAPAAPFERGNARRRRIILAALALALPIAGGAAWRFARHPVSAETEPGGPAPPPYSVAVLAFENMSRDPAQDYFSDGLADELISTLSRIDSLQVAARTSAFSFKGTHATVAEIARKLNVAAVLEGSVSREAGQVRVNVQLIDTKTGFPFWSRSYGRGLGDILTSQADIARAVAATLRVKLLGEELPHLISGGTHDPQALDAYLRGVKQVRGEDYNAALTEFDAAIALDPHYALARINRSATLRNIANSAEDDSPNRMARLEEESIAEAERALAQAPDLGAAHTNLGTALEEGRYDFKRAAVEIFRGRELAPSGASSVSAYAELQARLGHVAEAVEAAAFGVKLDPLSPRKYRALSTILVFAHRYPEALQATRRAVALRGQSTSYDTHAVGEIQYLQNQPAAALTTCDVGQSWPLQHCRALAYARLGRQKEAEAALAHLRTALGDAGALQYATIYAQWGHPELAIPWLETAYRLHDPGLIEMQVLPLLDPLRETPAFKDIRRRMNFPS